MTYNSLVQQISDTFNRSDALFLSYISNFIAQAHERLVREANSLEMVSYATGMINNNVNVLTKPSLWRRPLSLKLILTDATTGIQTYQTLEWRSYEFCRDYFPSDQSHPTLTLDPLFWGDYGRENLILSPTPSRTLNFEMAFYGVPPVITTQLQTNTLTQYAPNALLYACLLEGANFIKNDERVPIWQEYYQGALNALNSTNTLAKEDRSAKMDKD